MSSFDNNLNSYSNVLSDKYRIYVPLALLSYFVVISFLVRFFFLNDIKCYYNNDQPYIIDDDKEILIIYEQAR